LELFGQCNELHIVDEKAEGSGGVDSRPLFSPLLVGQKANASSTFRALELSCPQLSCESLKALALTCKWVFFCDGPDNASSNGLLKKHTSVLLRPAKNIFYIDEGCTAHLVNRSIFASVAREKYDKYFVGDVHAVAMACSQHSHVAVLQSALQAEVNNMEAYLANGF
jgi:hypothetical protein